LSVIWTRAIIEAVCQISHLCNEFAAQSIGLVRQSRQKEKTEINSFEDFAHRIKLHEAPFGHDRHDIQSHNSTAENMKCYSPFQS